MTVPLLMKVTRTEVRTMTMAPFYGAVTQRLEETASADQFPFPVVVAHQFAGKGTEM